MDNFKILDVFEICTTLISIFSCLVLSMYFQLEWKYCQSWWNWFVRSQLVWIDSVSKKRIKQGSEGQDLKPTNLCNRIGLQGYS